MNRCSLRPGAGLVEILDAPTVIELHDVQTRGGRLGAAGAVDPIERHHHNLSPVLRRPGAFRASLQRDTLSDGGGQPLKLSLAVQRPSGARRHELDLILESAGIRTYFEYVVSSDDVKKGKPDPESYLKAVEGLNARGKRSTPIRPEECAVIEDSREGIASAHAAGMKCIAVATSYPTFELSVADLVGPSLGALRLSQVEDLFRPPPVLQPIQSPQSN